MSVLRYKGRLHKIGIMFCIFIFTNEPPLPVFPSRCAIFVARPHTRPFYRSRRAVIHFELLNAIIAQGPGEARVAKQHLGAVVSFPDADTCNRGLYGSRGISGYPKSKVKIVWKNKLTRKEIREK